MATKNLTRKQALAALRDMNKRTFGRMVVEGLPRDGEGQAARYPWPEIHVWLLDRERKKARDAVRQVDTTLAESERREAAAKAEIRELDLAERRGDVVPRDEATRWFAEACARVRSKLLNLPGAVAMRVTGDDLVTRTGQAQALVDEVMEELAGAGDVPEPEESVTA